MLGSWALFSREIVQLSSANTAQTIGELFAWYWEELQANVSAILYIGQCLTLTNRLMIQ